MYFTEIKVQMRSSDANVYQDLFTLSVCCIVAPPACASTTLLMTTFQHKQREFGTKNMKTITSRSGALVFYLFAAGALHEAAIRLPFSVDFVGKLLQAVRLSVRRDEPASRHRVRRLVCFFPLQGALLLRPAGHSVGRQLGGRCALRKHRSSSSLREPPRGKNINHQDIYNTFGCSSARAQKISLASGLCHPETCRAVFHPQLQRNISWTHPLLMAEWKQSSACTWHNNHSKFVTTIQSALKPMHKVCPTNTSGRRRERRGLSKS